MSVANETRAVGVGKVSATNRKKFLYESNMNWNLNKFKINFNQI